MLLEGKSAVITGAASGIGAATAQLFAQEGSRVAVVDRRGDRAHAVAADLAEVDGRHLALEVDVADRDAILSAFKEVDAAFGAVDVLVNCAGIRSICDPLDVTQEDWDREVAVNLSGAFFCAQEAGKRMKGRGAGAIVNVSSTAGILAIPHRPAYCATKAALLGLTRSLASDLGKFGIRVNAVCPGLTESAMSKPFFEQSEWLEEVTAEIALRRSAPAEDQAMAILFLCSDLARYVTGVALPVDGGLTAERPITGSKGSVFAAARTAE